LLPPGALFFYFSYQFATLLLAEYVWEASTLGGFGHLLALSD